MFRPGKPGHEPPLETSVGLTGDERKSGIDGPVTPDLQQFGHDRLANRRIPLPRQPANLLGPGPRPDGGPESPGAKCVPVIQFPSRNAIPQAGT